MDAKAISAHLRAATQRFDWGDLPDDAEIPAVPLLKVAADTIDALAAALRAQFCPRPCNGRPDHFGVGDCVDAGECGCSAAPALALTTHREGKQG